MTDAPLPLSDSSLAREIFAPLGGIVALGAAAGEAPVPVGDFVAAHRAPLDRLLDLVRRIGGFGDDTMALVDELGWHRNHDAIPFLAMWSGFIELFPFDAGDTAVIRRMVRMGADLQTVAFLHALVAAASVRDHAGPGHLAEPIAEAARLACGLLDGATTPATAFRAWRVARLSVVLRPDPGVSEETRTRWRDYAHRLETLLPDSTA